MRLIWLTLAIVLGAMAIICALQEQYVSSSTAAVALFLVALGAPDDNDAD